MIQRFAAHSIMLLFVIFSSSCTFFCSKTKDGQGGVSESGLLNVEYLYSIGERNMHQGKFIIVYADDPLVDDAGNIIFTDEDYIKIYDAEGNGKKILGGQGQGPGEFEKEPELFLSPTGYLTALHYGRSLERITLYDREYNFVKDFRYSSSPKLQRFLRENGYERANIYGTLSFYALSENEYVYEMRFTKDEEMKWAIIHETVDSLYVISHEKYPAGFIAGGRKSIGGNFGKQWTYLLPDRRLMFINTDEDVFFNDDSGEITIHFVSLDTHVDEVVKYPLDPVPYPENPLVSIYGEESLKRRRKEWIDETRKRMQKRKYWPMDWLLVDDNFVFLFFRQDYSGDPSHYYDEITVDLFDAGNMKRLPPFRINGAQSTIRNGKIYKVGTDKDGFCEIKVYKLNESIYNPS
ncbi:hypothetical protein ACFL6L_02895 [candidate division KSB1 bacterium]